MSRAILARSASAAAWVSASRARRVSASMCSACSARTRYSRRVRLTLHNPANANGKPSSAPVGAPVARAVTRNAATVAAMMPSDTSVLSRTPALKHAAQPMATAGLLGDSPASTPPATPITTRLPRFVQRLCSASIQTIHAAADRPSATAIARLRALSVPGSGLARETVMITTTRPMARMTSVTRVTLTTRAPVTTSFRVAKPNTTST